MRGPSKFEIMRINRGCAGYLNHKAKLIAEIDSCELNVLRTLRARQAEEEYHITDRIGKLEQKLGVPREVEPLPPSDPQPATQAPVVEPPRRGLLSRWFFSLSAAGFGENA